MTFIAGLGQIPLPLFIAAKLWNPLPVLHRSARGLPEGKARGMVPTGCRSLNLVALFSGVHADRRMPLEYWAFRTGGPAKAL